MSVSDEAFRALRKECDELIDDNATLLEIINDMNNPDDIIGYQKAFGLSKSEAMILRGLVGNHLLSFNQLYNLVYSARHYIDKPNSRNTVNVFLFRLRRKTERLFSIKSIHNTGVYIDEEEKKIIHKILAADKLKDE